MIIINTTPNLSEIDIILGQQYLLQFSLLVRDLLHHGLHQFILLPTGQPLLGVTLNDRLHGWIHSKLDVFLRFLFRGILLGQIFVQ